jgi:hypothetical protein
MPLKAVLDTLEGLDDDQKAEYVEKDGKFVLKRLEDVEGIVFSSEVEGLARKRDELLAEKKALEAQVRKYKGLDPAKYQEAMDRLRQIDEKKLLDEGEVDKVVEQRLQARKAEWDEEKAALTEENAKLKELQTKLIIEDAVRAACVEAGAKPSAFEDFILRAKAVFVVDEAGPGPKRDGQVVYGKDGTTPMTVAEWVETLRKPAPHLFDTSSGGGAPGGGGTPNNENNPWHKDHFNLSEQARLVRENPAKAKALAERAGKKLTI